MKFKTKIISENFDEKTGRSTIIIGTPEGQFEGHATLLEEDGPLVSHFVGFRIAETKAMMKYLKFLIGREKYLYNFLNSAVCQSKEKGSLDWHKYAVKKKIESLERDYNILKGSLVDVDKALSVAKKVLSLKEDK